ncbi:unnamed protein product [Phytophthora fragariaefolia]|uniref:Histone-lysine N-methyltransferase, H3 lysine-79 specific n=1 Tax=Phytophthora fragariaefolia TaxID=1490495 RepID=A0A9W6UEA1_9STRA|nr:unnamed protein product [Phytophthora fragariaefolia]
MEVLAQAGVNSGSAVQDAHYVAKSGGDQEAALERADLSMSADSKLGSDDEDKSVPDAFAQMPMRGADKVKFPGVRLDEEATVEPEVKKEAHRSTVQEDQLLQNVEVPSLTSFEMSSVRTPVQARLSRASPSEVQVKTYVADQVRRWRRDVSERSFPPNIKFDWPQGPLDSTSYISAILTTSEYLRKRTSMAAQADAWIAEMELTRRRSEPWEPGRPWGFRSDSSTRANASRVASGSESLVKAGFQASSNLFRTSGCSNVSVVNATSGSGTSRDSSSGSSGFSWDRNACGHMLVVPMAMPALTLGRETSVGPETALHVTQETLLLKPVQVNQDDMAMSEPGQSHAPPARAAPPALPETPAPPALPAAPASPAPPAFSSSPVPPASSVAPASPVSSASPASQSPSASAHDEDLVTSLRGGSSSLSSSGVPAEERTPLMSPSSGERAVTAIFAEVPRDVVVQGTNKMPYRNARELMPSGISSLLRELGGLCETDVFVDIGSGVGNVVVQVVLATNVAKALGVEVRQDLNDLGMKMIAKSVNSKRLLERSQLVCQDIMDMRISVMPPYADATVVF